jgi:hypothetical protein
MNAKPKFTKRQINVLLVLNALVFVLFCGMFFLPWVNPAVGGFDPGAETGAPPHTVSRGANPGRAPYVDWETNIGGSGAEEVVAAYPVGSGIIVFGNTDSGNLDFADGPGGFSVRINSSGRNEVPIIYPERIKAAVPTDDDGFLLLTYSPVFSGLIKTDASGAEQTVVKIDTDENERVLDICYAGFAEETNYHVIIEHTAPNTKRRNLRILQYDESLEVKHQHFFNSGLNLDYIAAYPYPDSYILFANTSVASNPVSAMAYFEWTDYSSSENEGRDIEKIGPIKNFICDGVIPSPAGGFNFLIRDADNGYAPYLVEFSLNNPESFVTHTLGNNRANGARLSALNGTAFAFVYGAESGAMYAFGTVSNGDKQKNIRGFDNITTLYCHQQADVYGVFCGEGADTFEVLTVDADSEFIRKREFKSSGEKAAFMLPDGEAVLVIGTASKSGEIVKNNFGQSDVFIARIVY